MRRHAEGLIILSGSVPGRGWRDPVPVVDVLRAAVAEVEDYVRVDVTSETGDLVAGSAVNDVIHLVAELVENAAVFSPPNTRIEVRAERVGTGLVAEVEDRGLGLSPDELEDINRRLASTPEFDLARSEQLGLFVVSHLAARHDIKVSLRQSVYGGTTAVVLLQFGVVVRQEEAAAGPARRRAGRRWFPRPDRTTPAGRHRAGAQRGRGPPYREWPAASGAYPLAPWETGPQPLSAEVQAPPPSAAPVTAAAPWDTEAAASWFQPGTSRREPLRPDAPTSPITAGSISAGSPPEPERPGAASSGSHLGMPIRVPQASLAPQLRGRGGADRGAPGTAEDEAPEVGVRPPEATRTMLTLMQQGWRRGRVDDLDDPEGAPGMGTDR